MILFALLMGAYFYLFLQDLRSQKLSMRFWAVQVLFLILAFELFTDARQQFNSKEIEASIERGIEIS